LGTQRVHPVAAAGFSSTAEVYERARPSYPKDAVDWIVSRCELGPGKTVADVGAGTGKLTRLLVPSGARVIGVEPLAEMRAKLVETTPEAEAVDGTAEAIPLPSASVDAVTVAQAFHWFDHDAALPELHRVLRPGGRLVLIWNSRDLDDPLQEAVEQLLAPRRGEVAAQQEGSWRAPLERSRFFGPAEHREFRNDQEVTVDDLCGRVESTSFVAAMPPIDREELLVRVRALMSGVAEPFPFRYRTDVFATTRTSDPAGSPSGTSIEG
jgi:ubiquinone/menaquinone biosynthesis C-methylase UbiE